MRKHVVVAGVVAALAATVPTAATAAPVVRQASGADAESITAALDAFRTDLGGGTTAGANGSFGDVRREINWDGTPDNTFSDPGLLPANFFNANSPRGVLFSGPGTGFLVSADDNNPADPDPDLVEYSSLNATYDEAFGVFSAQKLFAPVGSNIVDVDFVVAGSETPATTSGFGAVFTDVDGVGSSIEFLDARGVSLANLPVPATPGNESLSFLGATFDAGERVASVRITLGTGQLALSGSLNDVTQSAGNPDVVVLDDFLYGEPQPIADEPSALDFLGEPKKITLDALGKKGISFQVHSSEDVSIEASLLGTAKRIKLGGKANVLLAEKSLGFGSDGKLTLKPKAKLLRGAKPFKAELRVVATDRSGNTSKLNQGVKVTDKK